MKVDGSLKSLLQGVSQQPPRDRLPGQCTEQFNMSSDPITGLSRRPPTDLVGSLGAATALRGWHEFETKDSNKFIAKFANSTVVVTDFNTDSKTVAVDADAVAYLTTPGVLRFQTVENETIVVNRGVIPAMKTGVKSYANKGAGSKRMAILQVLGGQYSRTYSVLKDNVAVCTYQTVAGSSYADNVNIRTSYIAGQIITQLAAHAINAPNYTVTQSDDTILIVDNVNTGAEWSLTCTDDTGNVNFKAMTWVVPKTADLPRIAPHGYVARVATKTDPEEDLFFSFRLDGSTDATTIGSGFGKSGYWQECVAPDVPYEIDNATMPHVLEYIPGTGTFKFRRGAWKSRNVGTKVSNPDPSFIGNPINDVTTFQSRLVFLAGSYVVMSRTNRDTDFWQGSANALVDTDPIDISSRAVEASIMVSATPHNRDLIVFSPKGQFVVFGRSALTPTNATLVLTTAFEAELTAKPTPAGRNVFFATNYGRYSGVREFYTEGNSEVNDSRPITQHVKEYITGKCVKLTASSNYDTLLVHTDTEKTKLYVYQYIWSDNEKVLSSWGEWQFAHDVVWSWFDEEVIYLIMQKANEFFLYRMSLDLKDSDGMTFPAYMDSRFDVFGVHSTFLLPYDRLHTETLLAVQGTNCPNPGMNVPIKSIVFSGTYNAYVVTLKYDMLGGDIVVGIPYTSRYIPTMPMVKDQDGVVIATAKLRIKLFIISLAETADINGMLRSKYGDGEPVSFTGRIVGDVDNQVGEPALTDNRFYVPFRENTQLADIVLWTDSFYPMTLLDVEWIGQYSKKGKRISIGASSG